jgi:hypothetical protein
MLSQQLTQRTFFVSQVEGRDWQLEIMVNAIPVSDFPRASSGISEPPSDDSILDSTREGGALGREKFKWMGKRLPATFLETLSRFRGPKTTDKDREALEIVRQFTARLFSVELFANATPEFIHEISRSDEWEFYRIRIAFKALGRELDPKVRELIDDWFEVRLVKFVSDE